MRCASSRLPPPGANITGLIPGFNTTILERLPRSMLLIEVESILMGFAFLAMIIVRTKRKQRTAACVSVKEAGFTVEFLHIDLSRGG